MEALLFRNLQLHNLASADEPVLQDVLIVDGRIAQVGQVPATDAMTVVEQPGLHASIGWMDLRCQVGEPGLEQKEDFSSAAKAAAAGGFTDVTVLPPAVPGGQTRAAIEYVRRQRQAVRFWPLAALTAELKGQDLTEMMDLAEAGAVAFADAEQPVAKPDVLLRALQYAHTFGGMVMQRPEQPEIAAQASMHEGLVSTRLGLKGRPALAEELMVRRDLELLAYAGGKLHFSLLSAAGSVALLRQAKAQGLQVSCDVAAHQLVFTDELLEPFDSNFKVLPPFRGSADVAALKAGLLDGTIDAVVSAHTPHDPEAKELEFDLAEFGVIGLETAFAAAHTALPQPDALPVLLRALAVAPRHLLRLPVPELAEGAPACLTLFDPERRWTPAPARTASKSRNSPFFGMELQGQVFGIVGAQGFISNPYFES